ncbi:protein bric-a-brac 2 isoform X2 [Frankliniella occidentalis]|uniref:Protein bric-a-brac 2 isoform X2 n=1 Tax=Frankliniella occidentalis TaxID=133901 RepID=A0A6J1SWH1_FRAOC|nr:protein bric-a-brac 2 isoform X2 [Frankliniella occidentalis]
MSELQDFCLRWSSYSQQLSEALRTLLDRELLVDVTLACDGRSLRAHRAVLSACSTYFQELFQESSHPHPIVILKDVRYQELEALVKFMYHGEVTVNNDILPGFLRTAETLHIRGLTDSALSSNTSTISPLKIANGNRRSLDEDGNAVDHDPTSSINRISPVNVKRIKTEQQNTSQYQHSVRHLPHQDLDGSIGNEGSADEGTVPDQDCSIRSEDLSHIHSEQYAVQRTITSLDGLSQLVMPVMQDDSSHSPTYGGVCANIQNQHHPQIPQAPSLQHQITHASNNAGSAGGGSTSRPYRHRVLYNQDQLLQLEAWYRQDRYPSGALMREYADTLAAMVPNTPGSIGAHPMRQNVDYWFQNRRRKDFHPEVMQQREKKKLAKTLWGNYNGIPAPGANLGEASNSSHHDDLPSTR